MIHAPKALGSPACILVRKLGHKFTAKDPNNSLNTLLYGKRPKFKRQGGKFSLA